MNLDMKKVLLAFALFYGVSKIAGRGLALLTLAGGAYVIGKKYKEGTLQLPSVPAVQAAVAQGIAVGEPLVTGAVEAVEEVVREITV